MVARLRAMYEEALPVAVSLIEDFPRLEHAAYAYNFEGIRVGEEDAP